MERTSSRNRTLSTSTSASVTSTASVRRRRNEIDAELDTKTFKMSDLIAWRPRTENELRKKWDEKRQKMLETMANGSNGVAEKPTPSKAVAGPRVKLNEKGEIVIDQDSLVVTETPENNVWTTVDDDLMPKKLNSMSFRKKVHRASMWTDMETDLFYYILSATGPDFGLMHEFIPGRTRMELKKKFTKEERDNPSRVDETLKKPSLLDKTLYEKANDMIKRIDEEKQAKEDAKKKKTQRPVTENEDQDLGEDDPHLVKNKEQDVANCEQPPEKKQRRSERVKVSRKAMQDVLDQADQVAKQTLTDSNAQLS